MRAKKTAKRPMSCHPFAISKCFPKFRFMHHSLVHASIQSSIRMSHAKQLVGEATGLGQVNF